MTRYVKYLDDGGIATLQHCEVVLDLRSIKKSTRDGECTQPRAGTESAAPGHRDGLAARESDLLIAIRKLHHGWYHGTAATRKQKTGRLLKLGGCEWGPKPQRKSDPEVNSSRVRVGCARPPSPARISPLC